MILGIVLAVLAAFAVSLALNRVMIDAGERLGLMDQPGERRVHTAAVPRAGGLAIWAAFMLVAFCLSFALPLYFEDFRIHWLQPFAAASLVLLMVGILDDRGGLKAWWKLLGQITAAAVFFLLRPESHGVIFGYATPWWVDGGIFIAWAVLLINAFNLIDGLDGLCGGLALIALSALGVLAAINGHIGAMAVMFLMAAAVLGFLRFNWNPARIFLGDAGSMLLGFFIAAAATQTTGRRAILGVLLLPIAVAGVPLLDVLLAVWRRSIRRLLGQWTGGKSVGVFSPDKDHLHHRLLRGNGQRKVTRLLHGLALALTVLAFLPIVFGDRLIGISLVGLLVLSLIGLRNVARIELVQSGSMLHLALKRPAGNRRLRVLAFLYDCTALAGVALFAIWLESKRGAAGGIDLAGTFQFTVIFVILGVIGLYLAKAYRRVWARATLRDLAGVCLCLASAGVICVTIVTFMEQDIAYTTLRVGLLATLLSLVIVPLPRCSVELLRELAVDAGHRRFDKKNKDDRHVVVYGAGDLGNLFIDYLKTCPPARFKSFRVVGFIDESDSLRRRIVRGFPVLGDLDTLDHLAGSQNLHGVIVAINDPKDSCLVKLREIAKRRELNLYSWCFDLTPGVMEINRASVATMAGPAQAVAGRAEVEALP